MSIIVKLLSNKKIALTVTILIQLMQKFFYSQITRDIAIEFLITFAAV
jgi:hypothetical protein